MKMNYSVYFLLMTLIPISITSCQKDPGEGGTNTIKGRLLGRSVYQSESGVSQEDYEANEDVYISYGNEDDLHDDDYKTSHDGSFEFKYLRPGLYKIFSYSLDSNTMSKVAVVREVEVKGKNKTIEINDLIIAKEPNNDGTAKISGKLFVKDYNSNGGLKGSYYGADEEVFLSTKNGKFVERVRTNIDGSYHFYTLRKGDYYVYAVSDNLSGTGPVVIPQTYSFSITSRNQIITAPDLVVNR